MTLFISDTGLLSPQQTGLITQAEARIGRPLTPGSVAGVARRSARRGAYYGAAAAGAGAYYGTTGYYNRGGGCARVRNANGRLVTVCR
jgi:hypothetical protein